MTHVPAKYRRRFVVGCSIGWLVAILPAVAALSGKSGPVALAPFAIAWVLSLVMLIITRIWEKRLRRAFLPSIGRIPWVFRISAWMAPIIHLLICLEPSYQRYIPGAALGQISGTISCRATGDDPDAEERQCGFEQWERSGGMKWSGEIQPGAKITSARWYPIGRSDVPGWRLLVSENKLMHEQDGRTIPLDGEALVAVLEDLSGQQVAADSRQSCGNAFERVAEKLKSREAISGMMSISAHGCPYGPDVDIGLDCSAPRYSSAWWWSWMVCGMGWLIMLATIHFSSRMTFGRNPAGHDPSP
ncbi:MAG: hypothetical protein QM755_14020 [Luteolibacter sp.]